MTTAISIALYAFACAVAGAAGFVMARNRRDERIRPMIGIGAFLFVLAAALQVFT